MLSCNLHDIVHCAQCAGTAEPREPREDNGTERKRYVTPPRDYLYPLYNQAWRDARKPAAQHRPHGHNVTGRVTIAHPDLNQPNTVARIQRDGSNATYGVRHRSQRPTQVAQYGTVAPTKPQAQPQVAEAPKPDPTGSLTPELARLLAWADSLEA